MKSQVIQFFVFFMAICALMVHCMPAGRDDEWRKKLSDSNAWGKDQYGKGGWEGDAGKSSDSSKETKYHISGSGHDDSSAYGSGAGRHSQGSAHSGTQTDSNNNKKKSGK